MRKTQLHLTVSKFPSLFETVTVLRNFVNAYRREIECRCASTTIAPRLHEAAPLPPPPPRHVMRWREAGVVGAAVVIARPVVGTVTDIAGRWQQVCASNMWRRSLSEGVVSTPVTTPLECERAACWLLLDEANGRLYAAAGHRIKAIVPAVMQRTNLEERFAASIASPRLATCG